MPAANRTSPPVPGNPGNTAKGQIRTDWADTTAQDCPSRAVKRGGKEAVKTTPADPLPTVTVAQIAAAQLRHQATALIRMAEQLEASVPRAPKRKRNTETIKEMMARMGVNA